jgi:hypothetical protein
MKGRFCNPRRLRYGSYRCNPFKFVVVGNFSIFSRIMVTLFMSFSRILQDSAETFPVEDRSGMPSSKAVYKADSMSYRT